jgi:hypothetical protein
MRIFTREQNLKTLARRWGEHRGLDSTVFNNLVAAGDSLTIEMAKKIISDGGFTDADWWLEPECDNCEKQVDKVIMVGEQVPDYDSNTATVCLDCLRLATKELAGDGGRDRFLSLLYAFQDASVMVTRATDAEWRRESFELRKKLEDVLVQAFETGSIPDSVWESVKQHCETS